MGTELPPGSNMEGSRYGHTPERRSTETLGRPGQMPALTDEERLIMKECERDSFYQRALPISFGCMLAAQGLVRSGRWSPHPRFGAFPKMIITGGVGYFIGKIMYLPVCQQKILEKIPHSNLATAIRKSKGIPQPEAAMAPWEDGSDEGSQTKSKLSDDYSAPAGLDDRNRPSMDREVKPEDENKEEKKSISYEELRRRNRQEYEDNLAKRPPRAPDSPSYKDSPFMPQQPWPDKSRSRSPGQENIGPDAAPSPAPEKRKRTTVWGDPIED